ncbi:MAG: sugar ABC transporter ATP-binding protein [Blautia sp.]|jgi:ribose transport system ATP-binding protein
MSSAYLELQHITKLYPGVKALDDVSVEFKKGEVHALVGENGAGKSTLIKILAGAALPNAGTILVDGKTYDKMTPKLAKELGIEVIYQEFNLMPTLSVAENIFCGSFIGNGVTIQMKKMEDKARELLNSMNINISPKTLVKDLSVAYMQIVEIAKAISKNAEILVMDEPTAPLTNTEVEILFHVVGELKKKGVTVIYISHRLNEIFQIADRITVLRDGKKIATHQVGEVSRRKLIYEMVGREVTETFPARNVPIGETMLELRHVTGNGVRDISFEVHKGEILGLAGLVGAGRTETVRMLFGADSKESGEFVLEGADISPKSPKEAVEQGILLIPEDRKRQGVILNLPIYMNITLPILPKISRFTVINKKKEKALVEQKRQSLQIKTPTIMQLAGHLSGGNQQKVVLAKWLACQGKVLIFDEPTRGIDVGAKQEIYHLMNALCEEGMAIIMISSEMDEVIGMSDRIVVLSEGVQTAIIEKEHFSQETILHHASGHH